MKKRKIVIVILALVIALIIVALIVNQVIDNQNRNSIEFENELVNEINSTNEIQKTEANVIENANINQDNQEELVQEDTNANTKIETQENKNEEQKENNKSTQEKMAEIQKKYKNNPEKLNQETIALYKNEKMSPFSGCLSSILQIIIILSVFWLVSQPLTYMKRINPEIIEKYTAEMQESGFEQNGGYIQISLLDYAETKYKKYIFYELNISVFEEVLIWIKGLGGNFDEKN